MNMEFKIATAELPEITLGELAANATAGEAALIDAGVDIFENCGKLVRPVAETVIASGGRKTRIARFEELGHVYLRDLLARHAIWQSYVVREKKMVRRDPPSDIAKTILARVGEWKFKTVNGVISTPTMRPDGSLLTTPGYDEDTGLILFAPPEMPSIPLAPSRSEAMQALALLEDLLHEFPFTDTFSEAVALSALITPIARGAFEVAPMHAANATAAGSGKSYLGDVVAAIAIGQPMPVIAAGRSDEETEKRLGASLMAGQPLISIDNVSEPLGGDSLCQCVERQNLNIRILGLSKNAPVKTRGTSFFATGNNLVIRGDMCRRVVTATLDPRLERPELRIFKSNPVAKVMANRGAYIAAALTICRAYAAAARPGPAKRLASFEGWSDTVRSALIWLGKSDPVDTMEAQRDLDPVRIELYAVLTAWTDAIGVGQRRTLSEVIGIAKNHPDLDAAVQMVAGKRKNADAASLGVWLRNRKGAVVGQYRLDSLTNRKGGSLWWVGEA